MREAHRLASRVWRSYAHPCSRHDFTLPQLFACLVVREMLSLSYRRAEALLRDSPHWLADIGIARPPDHNTLWRAFGVLVEVKKVSRMLDMLADLFARERLLGLGLVAKPLTIDSTCYERRHRSRHYDRVCRKMRLPEGGKYGKDVPATQSARKKRPKRKRTWSKQVNRSRSRKLREMPKLSLAVASACHLILAARARTGNGSDIPDFDPLLYHAWRRAGAKVKAVVADAGYDSEPNHRLARLDMGVRSVIPPKIGRPTKGGGPPQTQYRRLMHHRFARRADRRVYGQRAQSETVNSMLKRNFGDALRSVLSERREQEMLLRALAHNLLLRCAR